MSMSSPVKFKRVIKKNQTHYIDVNNCLRKFVNKNNSQYYETTRNFQTFIGIDLGKEIVAIPFIRMKGITEYDLQFKVSYDNLQPTIAS